MIILRNNLGLFFYLLFTSY